MSSNGQFQKGNPGKPKGAKNRNVTREWIKEIVEDPLLKQKYVDELKSMKGRHYTDAFRAMWEFLLPRYQSTSLALSQMSAADLLVILENVKEQVRIKGALHEHTEDRSN